MIHVHADESTRHRKGAAYDIGLPMTYAQMKIPKLSLRSAKMDLPGS